MNSNKTEIKDNWYRIENIETIPSPALVVYPERLSANIDRMIKVAGAAERLQPHVKTHKMPEVINMQIERGIDKFKCATIAEAEMVASCGAAEVLLAVQPVGPNIKRFFDLKAKFPECKISCIADCEDIIIRLSDTARARAMTAEIWLDINTGMNRTGIAPGEKALRLFNRIGDSPMLSAGGLHVYDGHIHEPDFNLRRSLCDKAYEQVTELVTELEMQGNGNIKIIAGGTPSFPVHALKREVRLSPGTTLLWDFKSSSSFTDMEFLHAALLITRVISKPARDLVCIDLGHKALASEMVPPRVFLFNLHHYTMVNHSEEHMVLRTRDADKLQTGDVLYGIPFHICPTVDRYDSVYVAREGSVEGQWEVAARKRKLTV